ncbi:ribosome recycling factor family protein [Pseudoalteromonas luteoviolacea]|uniref:Ribosome recycling factor n=1 Tax=Pseudoalteromonas luteoviolacea S4054 TaxID=1129367 RepID=A0A0F6AC37_9GAMM|nr:ribosome recycling factor family protein [Pseudoalteromonas luteoviolacea]AOT10649.1 hypothetical protein S4054249_22580 [Pseudoalteromonas luteoviolacea]AOT15283.1 hypothetical protein S40542_21015 [Pseudoalteromonas luteoviolacea]AOT20468.1 hypothetical protein S4054_22495 [Pseudoalteromonas luteoviolacea]KKE83750.1 hypothetical protein N479_13055 [Pseudoalteromonas luteoviolacea S4054]KZN71954.1 hypothetical protein N481_17420 [Pseudoalteromonas luteoviolacea S4047-1]
MLDIQLNSFVRRIEQAHALKEIMKSSGAQLSRVGRSRNWRLKGCQSQFEYIVACAQQQNEASWLWVIETLTKQIPKPELAELVNIVRQNPTMTQQQLITQTQCTLVEARKVFDIAEWE